MWVFWIVTGLLAAAAAALVIARAGSVARRAQSSVEDPALSVYRRQLAELDGQATEGLLGAEELRAARTEAGRRLLRTADARVAPERVGGRGSRLAVVLASVATAGAALGCYLLLGAPGLKDQPYATRLAGWRRADPGTLDPTRMAAVLREIAKSRPHDPQVFDYLGRAEMAAGDGFDAGRAFATAVTLDPGRAGLWAAEGDALVMDAQGKVTPQAAAAFQQAVKLDPRNAPARYYLGRAQVAAGDTTAGLADWRALLADLPLDDPRRMALLSEISHVQGGGVLGATSSDDGAGAAGTPFAGSPAADVALGPQAAFIHAMVDRQAAELRANPDNPEGWKRLVRSYGVLGDRGAQQKALIQARRLFAGRPLVLAPIEAEAAPRPAAG